MCVFGSVVSVLTDKYSIAPNAIFISLKTQALAILFASRCVAKRERLRFATQALAIFRTIDV